MKRLIFKVLRFSGLPFIFREFIQKNKVTILMFHDISEQVAEKTFSFLLKKYNVIDLNGFIDACENNNKSKIPKKALIITFDDGHLGNYRILPVIKKYKLPITIFLCSSIINTNRHFWFRYKNKTIETSQLKEELNKKRLELLSKVGFEQEKEFDQPQALQNTHISEMRKYVNMQSHTMFHPVLPKCDDYEARKEIFNSKEFLEKEYDFQINSIAYPNGDYTDREIELVKKAGYKCAITVDYGFNTIKSDMFRLKRLSSNDTSDLNELIVKSSGVWLFFKNIIKKQKQPY